jgi:membrane protein implicated in regulation of membrane protease activity
VILAIVWLVLAVALGVAEVMTTSLAFGPVAVGALLAAGVSAVGAGVGWQIGSFALTSLVGLVLVRPIAMRHLKQPPVLRSGTAALVGRSALVLEDVTPHGGRIRIGGEEWSARPYDEMSVIPAGRIVDVMQIQGALAMVYPRELS